MTVTAHTGAFDTADNSLEFIEKAINEKCEIIEVDVSFRPNGIPVIVHNSKPAQREGVLLEEVFKIVSMYPDTKMNLDLKSLQNLSEIDNLLNRYSLIDNAFYTGVFADWVETVKNNSFLSYYLNADIAEDKREDIETIKELVLKIKEYKAIGLNTHYSNISPLLIKIFHENDLKVSIWTVNEKEQAEKYIAMRPDNITTRKPDMIKALVRTEFKEDNK